MLGKCVVISICVCFFLLPAVLIVVFIWPHYDHNRPSLKLHENGLTSVEFSLSSLSYLGIKSPSLKSFLQASTAENSLSGLAVYSNLANACQPLDDVSNTNIQVHKIALVTLVNESACALQDLAVNGQNAGYSLLIYSRDEMPPLPLNLPTQKKIIIPVMEIDYKIDDSTNMKPNKTTVEQFFSDADRTNVDISCPMCNTPDDEFTKTMSNYLKRLYCWFLVGPLITLEWLRRTKKLCWMSGGQQADEQQAVENENVPENEIRTMEEGENGNEPLSNRRLPSDDDEEGQSREDESGDEYGSQGNEEQPLLIPVDEENTRQLRVNGSVHNMKKIFHKGVMCFAYIILIIAALPIAISIGGLSFFRFDEGIRSKPAIEKSFLSDVTEGIKRNIVFRIGKILITLWWSPFQIFCFFLYSRFACNTTWTVPTNFSKLIRSDWFASNVYLLVLAVVVPYCTSSYNSNKFGYFAINNTACTVCNVLFIIIVNKHKSVTRYVFYISVCMVCAYIQSDIVAVFYFALNSKGSLNNLKLTALRTLAIGLTLTVSFSSSMHIIRKLYKPQESLFEGLGEK